MVAPEPKDDVQSTQVVEEVGQAPTARNKRKVTNRYEPENERERYLDWRINLKFDLSVVAPLSFGFMFIAIDKSNIGYVATSSFIDDTNVTPNAVGLSLTLFSATYVPFHPINTVLAFIVGPRISIALQLLCCGILSTSHAAIRGNGALIALRLALGAVEAGYNPSALFLMSQFFPRRNLALRMGIFTCMFAAAGASAGAITYGLLSVASTVIKGWQLVFVVEGILPMITAAAVYFLVPQNIESALFLTPEERAQATMRMRVDKGEVMSDREGQQAQETATRFGHISWRDFADVITDTKKLLIILFGIAIITSMNAFPAFLPVLVEGMRFEGTLANVMSVSPFVAAIVLQMIFTWVSDMHMERSYVILGSSLPAAVAAIIMAALNNNAGRYAAVHVCVSGVMIGGSLISVWLANNTMESGARSFVLGLNGLTHIGGVIAGQLFHVKYGPTYNIPLYVVASLLIFGALGMWLVRYMYTRENKRRKQMTAGWDEPDFAAEKNSTVRRGDQRFDFVYTL